MIQGLMLLSSIVGGATRSLSDRITSSTSGRSLDLWIIRHREGLWIAAILLVAALAHGINMFNVPYYETDEGIYMSQAWAVIKEGKLAPYTYWYDHAPVGWFLIAVWVLLTGGIHTFGFVEHSGRMLMLLMEVASTFMLYRITRSISGSVTAATIASLVFALSPFGIYHHRRLYLDNIAVFWMLLSILPLVSGRVTLQRVWFSAFAMAISILTKELTVVLFPCLAYLVFYRALKSHRWFAVTGWLAITSFMVSVYVLMATLKSELFPTGTLLGGTSEHVSLLGTLQFQASRGRDGGIFDLGSGFWRQTQVWAQEEPLLVIVGSAAALLLVLTIKRYRVAGIMGLATLFLWAFLARGGIIIKFYLVPLMPLLALNVGLVIGSSTSSLKKFLERYHRFGLAVGRSVQFIVLGLCLTASIASGYIGSQLGLYSDLSTQYNMGSLLRFQDNAYTVLWTNTQAAAQRQALEWVKKNVATEDKMIIETGIWTDLHDLPNRTDGYKAAHAYWQTDLDPEIRDEVFDNDWRNVDYIISTDGMESDARSENLELVSSALQNSTSVVRFDTGGFPVTIRRVNKPKQQQALANPILLKTWSSYKERLLDGGRVVDPGSNRRTISEGQSYAMLQAVYMDDQETFDELWGWTERNLQVREDGLLAWEYEGRPDEAPGVTDQNSATDADQDTALALLFASRRWDTPEYEQEALEILRGIWEQETTVIDGERVVAAGDWARGDDGGPVVVNPSYFAPYAYRIFAEADPEHDWMDLVDSSYRILEQVRASSEFGGEAGLAPNWLALDPDTGKLLPAENEIGPRAGESSYDASRIPWRISLDYLWFEDDRAREALEGLSLPRRELEQEDHLLASYNPDGSPAVEHDALSVYAGVLPGLLFGGDQATAHRVFAERILGAYTNDPEGPYWGEDPDDYYGQNMAWFATAVMDGAMSNLWKEEEVIDWDRSFQNETRQEEPEE